MKKASSSEHPVSHTESKSRSYTGERPASMTPSPPFEEEDDERNYLDKQVMQGTCCWLRAGGRLRGRVPSGSLECIFSVAEIYTSCFQEQEIDKAKKNPKAEAHSPYVTVLAT